MVHISDEDEQKDAILNRGGFTLNVRGKEDNNQERWSEIVPITNDLCCARAIVTMIAHAHKGDGLLLLTVWRL